MQSSGVGNTVNMLSLISNCNFPFVVLVTMRGNFGEFNSWQVPMGRATPDVLTAMGIQVYVVERDDELPKAVDAALYSAFSSDQGVAVLLSQNLIGRKEW
jgi:sulfopyruvate decarboxylase TPP-binding subunit